MPPAPATASLLNSLEAVRRRIRLLSVTRGAGQVLGVAIAAMVVYLTADYLLDLPVVPRTVLMLGLLSGLGVVAARWIVQPLSDALSLSDIAGRLETRFPQFDDRLRSTLDFLKGQTPGSDAMKERTVEQALSEWHRVNFATAIDASPTYIAIAQAGGAFVFAILVALLVGPQIRTTALVHLFDPLSHRPWPRTVQIASDSDVPARVPVGQPIDVRVKLVRGDKVSRHATLCYQYINNGVAGPVQQELMSRGDGGVYAATLEPRIDPDQKSASLHAWIKAGDDQLDLTPVTVVPRLAIVGVQARVTPPAYVTGEPPTTINLGTGPASMVEGSHVELQLTFNKPLGNGDPILEPVSNPSVGSASPMVAPTTAPSTQPTLTWSRPTPTAVAAAFNASQSLHFHLRATDADGFTNTGLEEYEIIVRPDQMPSVQIEEPRQNEERTAVAVIPLRAVAEDDLGVNDLTLVIDRIERGVVSQGASAGGIATTNPADVSHWSIPLVSGGKALDNIDWSIVQGTGDRRRYRGITSWELSFLPNADLRGGDILEYHLTVTDNYDINGRTHPPVNSGKLRINIISQDELTSRTIADLQNLKDRIVTLRSGQSRTAQETANLQADLKNKPKMDDADKAAAQRLANEQSAAAGQARQLAERADAISKRLSENRSPQQDLQTLSHDVAADMNDAAENPMKSATQDLNQLPAEPDPQKRDQTLDKAKTEQANADQTVQRALDRLGNIGSLQQTIAKINDLLKQQREVSQQTRDAGKNAMGKSVDQLSADDRKKLEDAATQQAKIADQTNKAIEDMRKAADQLAKSDPTAAEAMNKAASTAAQQQVPASQKKASEQTKQNQQASAQSAQQQAELGLQMMANDLEQAQRRKLAELSKQLEDLQQQIANLVRRQAGHNLDNLLVQGPAAPKGATTQPSDLKALAERAGDQPEVDVNRLAGTLAPSQEQTSSNTRDISKMAEELPDGAAPSAQLLRAADHMDRAIVNLRDSKFDAAYDPSQVEALASLLGAQKTVDEQKKKVDDQISQGQKEAVRQKYVELKADQEKLNGEVARVDQIRDGGAQLKRADVIRLGQLPGQQGGLADRVRALDKDLGAVGSVVYTWANKDIADSMTSVKGDIPDGTKDSATMATQVRIVEQLDAMINDLAVKPKVSKFAAESGGGGGGGGGSKAAKLPTEAELRLLRDLQKMINTGTKNLDAAGTKDAATAAALGDRQTNLRNLLGQLLGKSSQGELKLGPEPDNKDQLPEEASSQSVDDNELDQSLLNDKPTTGDEQKETNLVGARMARSHQRLALNDDPGKVTQIIQDKIIKDLDSLVDQARQQQAEMQNPPQSKQPGQQQSTPQQGVAKTGQPRPSGVQQQSQSACVNPAQDSAHAPPGNGNADLSKEIKESLTEWGQVTPRLRAAQIEGSSESIVEQYRKLTEDYYRSMAAKAAQH